MILDSRLTFREDLEKISGKYNRGFCDTQTKHVLSESALIIIYKSFFFFYLHLDYVYLRNERA